MHVLYFDIDTLQIVLKEIALNIHIVSKPQTWVPKCILLDYELSECNGT